MTIEHQLHVFADRLLVMQILDAAENLIARAAVFLFELCAVAIGDDAADAKLDPVLELVGLLLPSLRLPSGVSPARNEFGTRTSADKNSATNPALRTRKYGRAII